MAAEIDDVAIVWDTDEWQRPIEWPDYSQIDLTNFEGMYFTYDTSQADHYDEWVGLYCACSGGYKVERGQIVNGTFVPSFSVNKSSGAIFEEFLDPTVTGYVVYRITAVNVGAQITSIGMRDMSATLRADGRVNRLFYYQPLVERYGRLPNLTTFSNWSNHYVQADTILDLKNITTLASVWIYSYNIGSINIKGFAGRPTSMQQTFYQCRALRYLNETDKFVTSSCTSLYMTFNDCNNLKFIDCGGWDTTNVTRMESLFSGCYNLYKLDVSNWNVSKVTGMTYLFSACTKLKEIDVSNWVVTLPTSYYQMFASCYRVEKLDLSGFDSSNVTSMYAMFNGCFNLRELNISSLRTPEVENMQSMFANCRSLKSVDVSNFDTSKVTSFASMFYYTCNLGSIDVSNFDFSRCTNFSSMFYFGSVRAKEIKLPNTITSGTVSGANMDSMFGNMGCVRELDLTGFDFSGVTAPTSTLRYCYHLEKVTLPSSLHYIGPTFFGDCRNLKTIIMPSTTLVSLTTVNAFTNANRDKTIYVPDNLVASYRTAVNWSGLAHITFAGISTYSE